MNIVDICLNELKIEDPKVENDNYVFYIKNKQDEEIVFVTNNSYYFNKIRDDKSYLSIKNKSEPKLFHTIFTYLYNLFYSLHENWFENTFTEQEYKGIFRNYLTPNIEYNCVDILVNHDELVFDNLETNKIINPTFILEKIIFEYGFLKLILKIKDFEVAIKKIEEENNNDNLANTQNISETEESNDNNLDTNEENIVFENENSENSENLETETNDINIEDNEQEQEPEIEEINIGHEDVEETGIILNDEENFMLYKIINSSIKKNLHDTIEDILKKKGIKNIDETNINELIYDTEEESDDEYLDDDDFEENYKNLM